MSKQTRITKAEKLGYGPCPLCKDKEKDECSLCFLCEGKGIIVTERTITTTTEIFEGGDNEKDLIIDAEEEVKCLE